MDYKLGLGFLLKHCIEQRNFLKDTNTAEDRHAASVFQGIRIMINEILKESKTSEKQALNIAKIGVLFTANDVGGAYLLGVFNVSGIDGLQKEITRIKESGLNPNEFLTISKNER